VHCGAVYNSSLNTLARIKVLLNSAKTTCTAKTQWLSASGCSDNLKLAGTVWNLESKLLHFRLPFFHRDSALLIDRTIHGHFEAADVPDALESYMAGLLLLRITPRTSQLASH
jgi:hypothetical protein